MQMLGSNYQLRHDTPTRLPLAHPLITTAPHRLNPGSEASSQNNRAKRETARNDI